MSTFYKFNSREASKICPIPTLAESEHDLRDFNEFKFYYLKHSKISSSDLLQKNVAIMKNKFRYFILSVLTLHAAVLFAQFPTEGYNLDNPTFLDSTVSDYDVFLTSEVHLRKQNSPRKKKMIEYLASKNSIDVVVLERGYHFGHWVNYFLETGDSIFLKEYLNIDNFFNTINGKVYDDEYEFFCWLRQFNVDNNLSIRVEALDVATLWDEKPILWTFLKFTDRNPDLKKQLAKSVKKAQRFMQKKNIARIRMRGWVRDLDKACVKLEIDNSDFLNFVFNLKQSIPWDRITIGNKREQLIAGNFKKFINEGDKVYGQFGWGHVAIGTGDRSTFRSFGSILNQDKYYQGKILTAGLICIDCDPDSPGNWGEVPGHDIFQPFLIQEEFDRLKPELIKLPSGTLVDLRGTDEKIKDYCQLLLIEFD